MINPQRVFKPPASLTSISTIHQGSGTGRLSGTCSKVSWHTTHQQRASRDLGRGNTGVYKGVRIRQRILFLGNVDPWARPRWLPPMVIDSLRTPHPPGKAPKSNEMGLCRGHILPNAPRWSHISSTFTPQSMVLKATNGDSQASTPSPDLSFQLQMCVLTACYASPWDV